MSAVLGAGVLLPGADRPAALLTPPPPDAVPVQPADLLGRKGLRYKDRATQLGLALARSALTDAGLLGAGGLTVDGGRVAVVVSSNLGNADTVCRAAATIAAQSTAALSPMDTPNASSNIIASEIAIRYGLRGPNLTLCNGVTSGLDAVRWGGALLRSGRAEHVLVVGVEPENPVTHRLMDGPVVDGGASLVLGHADRGAPVRALVGAPVRSDTASGCVELLADTAAVLATGARPAIWFRDRPAAAPAGVPAHGLGGWGECSGALGVLYAAAAVGWFGDGGSGPAYLMVGEATPQVAGVVLRPGREAA